MKEIWNERYNQDTFAYGQEPNDFLKAQQIGSGLSVLCLAEGEGRNGVYLAGLSNSVTCIDYSEAGLEKTKVLAQTKGVNVHCICADLGEYRLGDQQWDLIVGIFAHFPKSVKAQLFPQLLNALKPGGKILMEVYDQEQVRFGTGGPQQPEFLYSVEELQDLLSQGYQHLTIEKVYREVHEGTYHNGASATLQVRAVK
ncbi:MAG: hypothetical protein RLZZ301_1769 [Bacteroidota bacterium]|jgi:SAM-dependent methyltransferase